MKYISIKYHNKDNNWKIEDVHIIDSYECNDSKGYKDMMAAIEKTNEKLYNAKYEIIEVDEQIADIMQFLIEKNLNK